jgi:hypothetical protein
MAEAAYGVVLETQVLNVHDEDTDRNTPLE